MKYDYLSLPDIAILGKAGAGKTTAAMVLADAADYQRMSIADPLKDIAHTIWGTAARTDRDKLQRLGVAVREIDEDAWVNLFIRRRLSSLRQDGYCGRVVVDDVRFPNELVELQRIGFISIRVTAPRDQRIRRLTGIGKLQDESQLEHESECALDDYNADYSIENDEEKVDLQRDLLAILNKEAR